MKIAAYFYKVTLQDVDFTKKLKITRLISYLLETAGRNAFENHFGIQHLQTENFQRNYAKHTDSEKIWRSLFVLCLEEFTL